MFDTIVRVENLLTSQCGQELLKVGFDKAEEVIMKVVLQVDTTIQEDIELVKEEAKLERKDLFSDFYTNKSHVIYMSRTAPDEEGIHSSIIFIFVGFFRKLKLIK